jgi:hypothetical protein
MPDAWDQFQDAPAESGGDPWAQFQDADAPPQAGAARQQYDERYGALAPSDRPPMLPDEMSPEERAPSPEPSPFRGIKDYLGQVDEAVGRFNRAPDSGVVGTMEALGTLATGAIAAPILGTAESIALGTEPDKSFARYTYQPRTESGQAQLGVVGALASPLTESGADIALGPLAATNSRVIAQNPVKIARDAYRARRAGNAVPDKPVGVDTPVVGGKEAPVAEAGSTRPAGLASVSKNAVPTRDELAQAAKDAYKRADDAGVVVSENSLKGLKTRVVSMTKKEGVDKDLHPDSSAVLKKIVQSKGELTLTELETLRKVAKDAQGSIKPADKRLAGLIVDELDDYIDNLKDADVVAGDATKVAALKEARGLYSRAKKSETIANLMDRAETKAGAHYTQAGMEHALRGEFKTLALNQKELRRFSKAEQEAIKNIARGGKWENSLRNLGKFDPTSGGMSAFMTTLLAGGGAAPTGGASLLLPVAAYAAKRKATRITSRKVSELDEMVRRGPQEANALTKETAARKRNALADF